MALKGWMAYWWSHSLHSVLMQSLGTKRLTILLHSEMLLDPMGSSSHLLLCSRLQPLLPLLTPCWQSLPLTFEWYKELIVPSCRLVKNYSVRIGDNASAGVWRYLLCWCLGVSPLVIFGPSYSTGVLGPLPVGDRGQFLWWSLVNHYKFGDLPPAGIWDPILADQFWKPDGGTRIYQYIQMPCLLQCAWKLEPSLVLMPGLPWVYGALTLHALMHCWHQDLLMVTIVKGTHRTDNWGLTGRNICNGQIR